MAAAAPNIKSEKAPLMPTARTFCQAFTLGNDVFLVGGCDIKGIALGTFESIDLSKKKAKWNRLADMPTRRAGVTGGVIQDKLVLVGGIDETKRPHDVVDTYDPKTKAWSTLDSISEPRQGIATCVRDSRLYAIGGMKENGNPSDAFHVLDMESNRWMSEPPLHSSRYATTAFLLDDSIYSMGGRVGKLPSVACESYDFREKRWNKLPDAPSKRVFVGSALDPKAQRIYLVGGLKHPPTDGFSNEVQAFDVRANKWEDLAPLPQKKGDLVCRFFNDKLVVAGGMGAESMEVLPQVFAECHVYDPVSNSWSVGSKLSAPRSAMASALTPEVVAAADAGKKQKLFIVGGLGQNGPSNVADIIAFS